MGADCVTDHAVRGPRAVRRSDAARGEIALNGAAQPIGVQGISPGPRLARAYRVFAREGVGMAIRHGVGRILVDGHVQGGAGSEGEHHAGRRETANHHTS